MHVYTQQTINYQALFGGMSMVTLGNFSEERRCNHLLRDCFQVSHGAGTSCHQLLCAFEAVEDGWSGYAPMHI
jgi:hypothetical protein